MSALTTIARACASLVRGGQYHVDASNEGTLGAKRTSFESDSIESEELKFQEHIAARKDLPDAFLGRDVYIYNRLIKTWFRFLCSKHQTDDEKIQTFNECYLAYLRHMKDVTIYRFLFIDGQFNYGDGCISNYETAKHAKEDIEDLFARSLGDEAVGSLFSIRKMPHRCFNRNGDMAPEGYQYNRFGTDIERVEA